MEFDDKFIIDQIVPFYKDILTERESQIWIGIEVLGWQPRRIANCLGIAPSTVKSIFRKIRDNMMPDFTEVLNGRHAVAVV